MVIFEVDASASTILSFLPLLMHAGTPPTTPAWRAVSISELLSGATPDPSSGCWANSAE